MSTVSTSVAAVGADQLKRRLLVYALVIPLAGAASAAAGLLAPSGRIQLLAGLVVLALPFVAIWRIRAVTIAVVFAALLIEQYPIGAASGDITDQIPLFTSLNGSVAISGVYVNPFELLLAGLLLAMLIRAAEGKLVLPRSALAASIAVFAVVLILAAIHGIATGGSSTMTLWETRPFIYVIALYLIGCQVPQRLSSVQALLWILVVGVWIKTIQGLVLLPSALSANPRPDYILSHEDAFFFVLYIVLVLVLWLQRMSGRLRTLATFVLPFVVVVDLANNRRASWLMLGVAIIVLLPVLWLRLPDRRRVIAGCLATTAALSVVYLPLYWNNSGLIGGPAQAVRSAFAPDVRQTASDLYRKQEDANLEFNILKSPVIGAGFGQRIDYALPMIADLTKSDPFLQYIPHDGVLYIWLRLGIIGAVGFWAVIGFAFASACRLVRSHERTLSAFAMVCIAALSAYLVEGYLDLGLFWFRVAIFMGLLLGVLEIARRLAASEEPRPTSGTIRGIS